MPTPKKHTAAPTGLMRARYLLVASVSERFKIPIQMVEISENPNMRTEIPPRIAISMGGLSISQLCMALPATYAATTKLALAMIICDAICFLDISAP